MKHNLEGKAIIVTGGASGIGRSTALALAREGARVAVADVNEEQGRETVREIEQSGGEAFFARTDVSRAKDVESLVSNTAQRFGRLDGAFNNAGIEGEQAPTAECSEENWDRVLGINLKGVFLCLRYEIQQMLKQNSGGSIVNASSVAGKVGFPDVPAYTASKHGVIGLTQNAALEYAQKGIRVNAVCPGVIETEMIERITGKDPEVEKQYAAMHPMGRMGQPDEVAYAVVWLCSDASSFVTGHSITIDGGMTAR